MLKISEVADYFLSKVDEDAGESISNLKLQKMIYYAQGYHLALFKRKLFRDSIEAWEHGPVVPALYHDYKKYGRAPIPTPDEPKIPKENREFLDEIYDVIGQFSAWKLRDMTHEETPWQDAYKNLNKSTITIDALHEYFDPLVN